MTKLPGPLTPWAFALLFAPLLVILIHNGIAPRHAPAASALQTQILDGKFAALDATPQHEVRNQVLVLGDSRMRSLFVGKERTVLSKTPPTTSGLRYAVMTAPRMRASGYLPFLDRLFALEPTGMVLDASLLVGGLCRTGKGMPGLPDPALLPLETERELAAARRLIGAAHAAGIPTVVVDLPLSETMHALAPAEHHARRSEQLRAALEVGPATLVQAKVPTYPDAWFADRQHLSEHGRQLALRRILPRLERELTRSGP
jgi:hypothetical protein